MTRILLSEKQVSEATSLKSSTLKRRRQLGLPPRFLKIGHKVLYDQKDVDAFLDSCIRESTTTLKKTLPAQTPTEPLNQSPTFIDQENEV